jgi:hypothetical protein
VKTLSSNPSTAKKKKSQKRTGRVAQVVEHQPSKGEALSSNSNAIKIVPTWEADIWRITGSQFHIGEIV